MLIAARACPALACEITNSRYPTCQPAAVEKRWDEALGKPKRLSTITRVRWEHRTFGDIDLA